MCSIRSVMALCLALVSVPALAVGGPQDNRGGGSQARPSAPYQEYDRFTGATFTAAGDAEGNAHFTIRVGEFLLEKALGSTGETTLRLTQGKDVVTIAMSQSGYHVERGRKSARFNPRSKQPNDADANAVRSLLVGSQAVTTFKRLTAALEDRDESEEDGALVIGALIDGGMVLALDGDPDATKRIAKRVTRKHRAQVRAVKAKARPDFYKDCVGMYQVSVIWGWDQFASCYMEAQEYSWFRSLVSYACSFEWNIRAQQYLWQFIGCLAIPL